MALKSDASRVELLKFCKNFKAWMWEQIIVWGMAILWGHQWVVYQLATSHGNLGKKKLVKPSSTEICDRGFLKQNSIKSHLWASLKLDTLDAFDASIIMWDRVREYGLESSIWVMAQDEYKRILSLD